MLTQTWLATKGPWLLNKVEIQKWHLLFFVFIYFFLFTGAMAPSWLALLPENVEEPKGAYVWFDKRIIDWVNGPTPSPV